MPIFRFYEGKIAEQIEHILIWIPITYFYYICYESIKFVLKLYGIFSDCDDDLSYMSKKFRGRSLITTVV